MKTKPLKFTVDEMQKLIDDYFAETPFNEWTVSGLALRIGSKRLLCDYGKRDGYKNMIETARLKVENSYESDLRKNGGSHNIFALKNFGWSDAIEQNMNHNFTGAAKINFTDNSKK